MKISVRLYGALRDKLPAEQRGKTVLEVDGSATVADVMTLLKLGRSVNVSVNEGLVEDRYRPLSDGETVIFFSHAAGG